MAELDEEVAAVWEVILNGKNEWLANRVFNFDLTYENLKIEFEKKDKQTEDIALCTILKNRVFHGGILAKERGTNNLVILGQPFFHQTTLFFCE